MSKQPQILSVAVTVLSTLFQMQVSFAYLDVLWWSTQHLVAVLHDTNQEHYI